MQVKKVLTQTSFTIIILMLMVCLPSLVHAQVLPDPGNGDAPIDGGLSILVAAGVGYGVKKVKAHRKKKAEGQTEL